MRFKIFSQVVLREDIPKYGLKKGATATIVEHYQMPEGEEDGYSLEGFHVEGITVEVAESHRSNKNFCFATWKSRLM
jgi:Domain of unknown function (DUF4926)